MRAGLLAGLLVGLAGVAPALAAQTTPTPPAKRDRAPFAWPWEVTFQRLLDAEQRLDYVVQHVRRVRDVDKNGDLLPGWLGIRERLVHAGRTATSPARFSLGMEGVEGRVISDHELQQRQAVFDRQVGFLRDYQSFRIADPERAQANYRIAFLDIRSRLDRAVYRLAVYAPLGQRSSWLLEIDVETGYPLYRGEYDVGGNLVAEVEVVSFLPLATAPVGPKWWKPAFVIGEYATADECLAKSGIKGAIAPSDDDLPAGFRFEIGRVVEDPLDGSKKAILVYNDGLDRVFVVQARSATKQLHAQGGHLVGVHRDTGMTQCIFVHEGVMTLVIGRGAEDPVRHLTAAIYARRTR